MLPFFQTNKSKFLLLLAAVSWFGWRGPMRMLEIRDSLCPYLGSRLLVEKKNPYDKNLLEAARLALKSESDSNVPSSYTLAIYPPTTLVFLSLFSWMDWGSFRYFLMMVDTIGLVLVISVLRVLAGIQLNSFKALVLWAIGLSWAPWHSGMATGNLTLPAISVGIVGWGASEFKKNWLAGLCIFLSLMLKPQIGGLFLLALILRQNWKLVLCCLLSWGSALSFILVWMNLVIPEWWREYRFLVNGFLVIGGENDPSLANYLRHDLINLQQLLYSLTENQEIVLVSVISLTGLAFIWLLIWHRNKNCSPTSLLTVATVTALGLLPVYHRFYDASLLLLAFAWGIGNLDKRANITQLAIITLVGCVPFLIPGAAFLAWAAMNDFIPETIVSSWYWAVLLISHQVWALLLVVASLIVAMPRAVCGNQQVV